MQQSRAARGRHQVVLMVQEPDRPAWFDAKLLSRVFRHLIENAALYSPPESRIVLRSKKRVEGRLEFEVEDNGPGIDKVDLPHIFEKVHIAGRRGRRWGKEPGWGWRKLLRRLCGHCGGDCCWLESNPGARMYISILGAAGGERADRGAEVVKPVRRSNRTLRRDDGRNSLLPIRECGRRAMLRRGLMAQHSIYQSARHGHLHRSVDNRRPRRGPWLFRFFHRYRCSRCPTYRRVLCPSPHP